MIFFAGFAILVGTAAPQEDAPVTASPADVRAGQPGVDDVSTTVSASKPSLNVEKKKKAMILLGAVSAIAVLGIGAIAIVMVWATRLRRFARDLGPAQTTLGNDFWFLKPPKPIVTASDTSDSHRPPHKPPDAETVE